MRVGDLVLGHTPARSRAVLDESVRSGAHSADFFRKQWLTVFGKSPVFGVPQRIVADSRKELPGITLAWVTTLQVLPNGNVIIGNCHAGPTNPQLIEVTREKKVVWTFKDFKTFGDSLAAALVLDIKGDVIR